MPVVVMLGLSSVVQAAPNPGDRCADLELRAVAARVTDGLKCHIRLPNDGSFDPACVDRANAKFASAIASAQRFACLGANDDLAHLRDGVATFVGAMIDDIAPPGPCGAEDAYTCGGACEPGSECVFNGMDCRCVPDLYVCDGTLGFFCPRRDQKCENHVCVDPEPVIDCMDGIAPDGAGICNGDCPGGLECVFTGADCRCLDTQFDCESSNSFCGPGFAFGFCKDSHKTCVVDGDGCACE